MKSYKLPGIVETVEWVEKNHREREGKKIPNYCELCGGTFPCANKRLTVEIRRLWGQLKPDDRPRASGTKTGRSTGKS